MQITQTFDEKNNMILKVTFKEGEQDDLKRELEQDYFFVEGKVCEVFFNGEYRFVTDDEKMKWGDLTDVDMLTNLHEYNSNPDSKEFKSVDETNKWLFSAENINNNTWIDNLGGTNPWIYRLIKDGHVTLILRNNM